MKTLYERLIEKVEIITETGCWIFTGALKTKGYGDLWRNGKVIGAHKISYEMFVGPVPDGLDVCHRCDVRCCVNPHHLFIGTRSENMQDCKAKGRQPRVTKFTPEQVIDIRKSSMSTKELAAMYGVHFMTIYNIRKRISYAML